MRYVSNTDNSMQPNFKDHRQESNNLAINQDLGSAYDKSVDMCFGSKDGSYSYFRNTSLVDKSNAKSRGSSKPRQAAQANLTSFDFDSNTGENPKNH